MADQLSPQEFLDQLIASNMFEGQEEALEQLQQLVAQGIHPMQILRIRPPPQEETKLDPMLESFDVEGVARYIAEKECKRVVIMCGAGISTSAGIPDFRTPGTGLYDNLQKYNLPHPQAIFELDYFRKSPEAFYTLAKEMWLGNWQPTPAHYFIKLLEAKGILLRCYTQNIDSLEPQAGVAVEKVVAAHGNFDSAHVIDTEPRVEVPIGEVKAALDQGQDGWKALRERHNNLVKPSIVFFGEALPERFGSLCQADLKACDCLLVLGTSLVVAPFNSLVTMCAPSCPRLLVNREAVGTADKDKLECGFRFNRTEPGDNWRDVWFEGDCDSGCRALAEKLGWTADLEALIDSKGTAEVNKAPWATGY